MIDIIIPVYNTPLSDLERCLDSIVNQTYKDYKVYIIDDGSNELTKTFLDNYVQNKDNFTIKHTENHGVSYARNLGMTISNSKYLTFVDADDSLEPNFLNEAYRLAKEHNLDLIIGGYNEIKDDTIIRTRLSLPGLHIYDNANINLLFEKLLTGKTSSDNKEIGDTPTGRIYTRLFKRNSINSLRFNTNIHMSEDTLFMIDYMYNNPRIGITNKVWYNHYHNSYSISNGTDNEVLINYVNEFVNEIKKRIDKENNPRILEAYNKRIDKANDYIKRLTKK